MRRLCGGAGGLAGLALITGCLGPRVDDEPVGGDILPPGSEVPSGYDDPDLAAEIDEYDGVDRLVPLLTGFAGGAPAHWWDFGPTVDFAAPIYSLRRRTTEGDLEGIGHPNIFDAIPGDPGYSPYWAMWFVEVTEAYGGEVLPSLAALQQAQRDGLVLAPDPQGYAVNCPVVAEDVTLEQGGDRPPWPPNAGGYYRGVHLQYYDFGPMPLVDGVHVPDADLYVLRREGGEPLREPARGVDMTGDGDIRDANDIFARPPGDPDATPLCRTVSVTVPSTYGSIDTYASDAMADATAAGDLFEPGPERTPVAGAVVAYTVTDELRNCPFQPGGN